MARASRRLSCVALLVLLLLAAASAPAAGEPSWIKPADPSHLGPAVKGSFAIAVLPDTQNYSWKQPSTLHAQTRWVADHAAEQNIRFVLQLGDVTNHNSDAQWRVAREAFRRLDGVVPYAIAPGNHDFGKGGKCNDRRSLLSQYFPVADFRKLETFGGVYDREPELLDNSWHRFRAGGRNWLILALEFAPRDDVVRWANEVVASHGDCSAIAITHAYLDPDGVRFDRSSEKQQPGAPHRYGVAKKPAGGNDGEQLWKQLISCHPNTAIVLNGHVSGDGLGYLASRGRAGNVVHQMVVNYQFVQRGGDGWMRLLQFLPDGRTVRVRDYSPTLDKVNIDPQAFFEFALDGMKPRETF